MAVLKSPRNNKNKKRWSQFYAFSLVDRPSTVSKWIKPRKEHKLYKNSSFIRAVETFPPSTTIANPFVKPHQESPLPCNTHFQNLNNTIRVYHPLIFLNVI